MKSNRVAAIIIGLLFFAQTISFLVGDGMIASAVQAPDYLASLNSTAIRTGVLVELINCLAILGIGALIFPILRQHNEAMAFGFAGSKIMESVLLLMSAIGPLLLVPISQEHAQSAAAAAQLETLGVVALEWYDLAFQMGMIALGVGGMMLCYVLYGSKLVPRALAVLGFVGYVALLANGLLEVGGYSVGMALFIPGTLFEALCPLWLIIRGFNIPSMTPQPATA